MGTAATCRSARWRRSSWPGARACRSSSTAGGTRRRPGPRSRRSTRPARTRTGWRTSPGRGSPARRHRRAQSRRRISRSCAPLRRTTSARSSATARSAANTRSPTTLCSSYGGPGARRAARPWGGGWGGVPGGAGGAVAEPILIWGAGAIGGTIGAYWRRAGLDVLLVDKVAEHVETCRTTGLAIEGPVESFTQVIAAATPDEIEGVYRRVVLAVKAQHTEAALDRLAPHLAAEGCVLSAQNGLNELAIARRVGPERTMGCFVNFGADWLGPGRILYGNRGAVVVGEVDGSIRDRTREMHGLLRIFEPDALLTDDIWG